MADPAAPGSPPSKRQRTDGEGHHYTYDPEELSDFSIRTSDGQTLGLHRCFVLRYSKMIGTMLQEFEMPPAQLPVTETAADIRANFLDLIYDRSAAITPDNVLHVLDLADKYAAPRLIEACGAVMASSSFFLTGPEPPTALEGNCDALEALALARKHDFHALAARCRLCIQQAATLSLEHALEYFNANAAAIAALELPDVVGVLQSVTLGGAIAVRELRTRAEGSRAAQAGAEAQVAQCRAEGDRYKKNYGLLLAKYNKLIAKARAAGV